MTELRTTRVRGGIGSIGLVIFAMLAFSIQDVVVKIVAEQISLWQLQFIRSLLVLWLLLMMAFLTGQLTSLAPRNWFWPLVRAVMMCGAYLFFYASLPLLSLSTAAAAFFTGPMMITILAVIILREPIGPRRVGAVILGFAGVLLIIRPGMEGWSPVALMPVGAALCYAFGVVITRWRCHDETSFALSMGHNLLYALIGLFGIIWLELWPLPAETRVAWPFLANSWMAFSALAGSLILFTAMTHLFGVICSVRAYQMEDASRIAPFEYVYLIIMPIYDIAIWQNWPDPFTLLGIGLITLSGIFVAWREGRPARPQVHPRGEMPWTPDDDPGNKGA